MLKGFGYSKKEVLRCGLVVLPEDLKLMITFEWQINI